MLCLWEHTQRPKLVSTRGNPGNSMTLKCKSTANYTGHSGLPWWALTVILLLSFLLTTLYGILTALIGFQSQTTAFYEMITGALYSAHR